MHLDLHAFLLQAQSLSCNCRDLGSESLAFNRILLPYDQVVNEQLFPPARVCILAAFHLAESGRRFLKDLLLATTFTINYHVG